MAQAAYVKFQSWAAALGLKLANLNTDTIAVYLSNTAPDVATDTVKADLAEIATGSGYAGPIDINNAYSESGGVGTVSCDATITITASGGSIGPFRYIVLWDSTANRLIAYWDYGAGITVNDGATFTMNFNNPSQVAFTIQ